MMALLRPMQRYASMIAQLREVPVSEDGMKLAEAFNTAQLHARQDGVDMVVGLAQNDTTGEPEWNYCPFLSVGPAFVVDPRFMIASHGDNPVFYIEFEPNMPSVIGLFPLLPIQVACISMGEGFATPKHLVLQ